MKEVYASLALAHAQLLSSGKKFLLPYNKVTLIQKTIEQGVSSRIFDNFYRGVFPTRVLFVFVRDSARTAGSSVNPFRFENLDLSFLQLIVDGEPFPRQPYQPNFESGEYIREYMGLLDTLRLDVGNRSLDLTPKEWASTYPFFMFTTNPGGYPSLPREGSARLVLQFRKPTEHVYNVLCFAESPAMLQINGEYEAIF
jgi:hypothetical protein